MIRFKNLSYNIFMKGILKIAFIVLLVVVFLFTFIVIYFILAFKTDYKDFVFAEAQKNDIDPALVFAVIKAESKFDKNAKSKAGAIGLMQIRLETANYVCEINGENAIAESQLFDPQTNIKIGTKYLLYLAQKFESLDTVICAYNAGETVVKNWLLDAQYSKDGKTLVKVPYKETKDYLSKVMFNLKIYKKMLKI